MRLSTGNTVFLLLTALAAGGLTAVWTVSDSRPDERAPQLAVQQDQFDTLDVRLEKPRDAFNRVRTEELPPSFLAASERTRDEAQRELQDVLTGLDSEQAEALRAHIRAREAELEQAMVASRARLTEAQQRALSGLRPDLRSSIEAVRAEERQARAAEQRQGVQQIGGEVAKRFGQIFGLPEGEQQQLQDRLRGIAETLNPQDVRRQIEEGSLTPDEARQRGAEAMQQFGQAFGEVITPERQETMRAELQGQVDSALGEQNAPLVPRLDELGRMIEQVAPGMPNPLLESAPEVPAPEGALPADGLPAVPGAPQDLLPGGLPGNPTDLLPQAPGGESGTEQPRRPRGWRDF